MLPYPAESISLDDLKLLNQLLLECGADISEVNTVRKHISRSKGGRLALAAFPADVVTVIISDVIGNPLDMIASGPTVPDPTTYRDAMKVLTKYKITGRVPETVIAVLRGGLDGRLPETLKPGDSRFEKVRTAIIAENGVALKAACDEARRVGFEPSIISIPMQGEAKVAAAGLIDNVKRLLAAGGRRDKPTCLISGGETTVTIKGRGKGGRNTEFALAAAIELQDLPGVALLSCGTDGTDGPTDAAGAYCDQSTIKRALDGGLDPEKFLSQNNSYTFFSELDDLIITGPTGTNVMDIQIVLIDPR